MFGLVRGFALLMARHIDCCLARRISRMQYRIVWITCGPTIVRLQERRLRLT